MGGVRQQGGVDCVDDVAEQAEVTEKNVTKMKDGAGHDAYRV